MLFLLYGLAIKVIRLRDLQFVWDSRIVQKFRSGIQVHTKKNLGVGSIEINMTWRNT